MIFTYETDRGIAFCVSGFALGSVHGIPDARPLQEGDVIAIDVSLYLDGVHGDCCGTYFVRALFRVSSTLLEFGDQVGEPSNTAKRLEQATRESLDVSNYFLSTSVELKASGIYCTVKLEISMLTKNWDACV